VWSRPSSRAPVRLIADRRCASRRAGLPRGGAAIKTHVLPPSRIKIGGSHLFYTKDVYVSAWSVVSEVAGGYRYWRAVASETQRDLLRFAALNSVRVSVDTFTRAACLMAGRTPVFYFDRELVNAWLDGGGRAWIIAELEARSPKRVIAFPRNRGRA